MMNFENLEQQKDSYHFNELTSLAGVKPYVLRFWESEFDQINPRLHESSGAKVYSPNDLETINRIKSLLFTDKLSIPEAKALLDEETQVQVTEVAPTKIVAQPIETTDENPSRSNITSEMSSLEKMQSALAHDFKVKTESIAKKQFNDQDVLNLVQAKRKLNNILKKMNTTIERHNW